MKNVLLLIIAFFISNLAWSQTRDQVNERPIILSHDGYKSHLLEVADPEAYYTISTATLSIVLDPVEYSEFTIILSTAYANIDYVATSATVNIPVGALDDVIEIYIESDGCGCYYGVLDQSEYNSTY